MEMKFERIVNAEAFKNHLWKSPLEHMSMSHSEYDIVPVTAKDSERILDHLRRFFFREEPLNIYVKLLGENNDEMCEELEDYCVKTIPEGLSLMAVTPTGKVVGVALNGSQEPGHLEEMQNIADTCAHPRFKKILQLLVTVDRKAEVFTKYPDADKLVEVRILSVDTAMRGRGIAKALLQKTRELATQQGYPLIRVDCTSHFSALAVARLGLECIFKMKYEDYQQNGEPVFKPELPHTAVTTYVQRLQPQ